MIDFDHMVVMMTGHSPTPIRILADDLTGALDCAAVFAASPGPVYAVWEAPEEGARGSLSIDAGTRELSPGDAARRAGALARHLGGADIAFKKIDSLLRGSPAEELAACVAAGGFESCILAPAFPAQGRLTRGGVQHAPGPDGPAPLAVDLAGRLAALGLGPTVVTDPAAVAAGAGVLLCDAGSDADLAAIVASGRRRADRMLWCGTGGLATALAGPSPPVPTLPTGPVLFVVGSDHPVSRAQMAALEGRDDPAVTVLPLEMPPGMARDTAGRALRRHLAARVPDLPRPALLVAAGGETLVAVMRAAGARRLRLAGAWRPGVPVSVVEGGRWAGITVVSKSGAFGAPGLWVDLLRDLPGVGPQKGRARA